MTIPTVTVVSSILYVFNAFYLFYGNSKNIWLSYEFWSRGEKPSSIVLGNLGLLVFAILGFIVAIYRGVIAFKNTNIAQATQTTNAFTNAL